MKPKNGSVTKDKSETMMNLLDSTDSDVEWLNLPPIKGKKPKKKKFMKEANDDNTCTLWCFLKGFLVFCVIAAICLLSIVITWMSGEITDLRQKLESVESRSEMSVQDLNTFVVQLSEVNKTVYGIKTGKNSLNEVIKNISSINEQISKLSHKVDKLSAGLEAAPELRQVPDKLQTVSKTVVNLGSDVTVMKDQVESFTQFIKTANTRLDGMASKMNEIDRSSKTSDVSDLSPDLANLIQTIPAQLGNLNISLMTQISLLRSSLTENEGRLVQLENTTAGLTKNLSSISHVSMPAVPGAGTSDLKTQVGEIVQEMLKKNTSNTVHDVNIDQKTMEQLLGNMDNLTTTVQALKENYKKILSSGTSTAGIDTDNGEQLLSTFETGLTDKLEVMNTSVVNLRHDLNHYAGIINQHSNQLVTVTHQISEIHRFMLEPPASLEPPSSANQSKETTQETKPPVDKEVTGKTTLSPPPGDRPVTVVTEPPGSEVRGNTSVAAPGTGSTAGSTVPPLEGGMGGTKSPLGGTTAPPLEEEMGATKTPSEEATTKTTTTKTQQGLSTANPDTIKVSRIHNMTELEVNFRRWDLGGNGKVRFEDLRGYLGPEMPSEEQLQKFDANHDRLYSLPEFATAFGFNIDDLPANSPFREPPPR